MKDYSRAYNRYKQHVKFIKRVKDWFCRDGVRWGDSEMELAIKGNDYTFLRTTGRPCNCEGCAYLKYERTPKGKIDKKIWDDIQDNMVM